MPAANSMKLKSIIRKIKGQIDKRTGGMHNFFACYLPPHKGFLVRLILNLLFSEIRIPRSSTAPLQPTETKKITILVSKYKSFFEFFFYHTRYRKEGLICPTIGFDYRLLLCQPVNRFFGIIFSHANHFFKHLSLPSPYKSGYIQKKLLAGDCAFLSLVEKKGFYRRFVKSKTDPIHYLIEIQKSIDRPIVFLPQIMLFNKAPDKIKLSLMDILFGTREKPGRIRRLVGLIKNPKRIFIETSEPVILAEFLNRPEVVHLSSKNQAVALRRYLLAQINLHRQSITGPALKSRLEIKEELLTNPKVQQIIAEYSHENNLSISLAQRQASDFLDEIAANLNLKMIRAYEIILRWVFKHIFEGMVIDYDGLERVKRMSKRGPLILVPCHKSHLDYLILSYVFFHHNMPIPLIAAGKNLSFWPLGPIFRSGGAFFLRRTFKGEKLYPKIFAAYIHKILEEGFHVEFFIEGGRSRTGKLLAPKIGFLSLLMEAYHQNNWADMIFVPIYIGYDRVLEEKAYIHEMEGGKKTPENLKNMIRARKFLKKKYGKIYLNFHEPFSLKDHLTRINQQPFEPIQTESADADLFGKKLLSAINRVSVITPHSIIAAAILNATQKRFYHNQLMEHAETYIAYLISQDANLADTIIIDRTSAFHYVIDSFVQSRFIEKSTSQFSPATGPNPLYKVIEARRPSLEYYKNSGIVFFIPAAFTALAILKADAFQFSSADLHSGYKFLCEFFENEFILDPQQPIEYIVRKNIKAFIDDAIIMPHPTLPDTYNLTSTGFRKLKVFGAFLVPYFESYWVVLSFFMKYTKQSIFEVRDYMKKIQALGNRMYKRKEIERIEAMSKINYENAVKFFTTHGLKEPEKDREKIEFYADIIQHYRRYLPQ